MNQNCHLVTEKQIANEEYGPIFIKGLTEEKQVIPHISYLLRKAKKDWGKLERMKLHHVNPTSHYQLTRKHQWPPEADITVSSLFPLQYAIQAGAGE